MHSLVDRRRLADLVERWRGARIVVIGDALLDEWCHGDSDRLSREAPVPVVWLRRTREDPGGGGNTAVNLAALGARPVLVAPVGEDAAGTKLHERLVAAGVEVRPVVVPGWRTPAKRRVIAGDQIVVRLEEGHRGDLPEGSVPDLVAAAAAAMTPAPAAVVLCDYGYGALGAALVAWLRERRDDVPVVAVDAHEPARLRCLRPTLVTPSYAEALRAAGHPPGGGTPDRVSFVEQHAGSVLDGTGARLAAITLDVDGALVIGRGVRPIRTTSSRATPDGHAVGAGDAYIAALVLATATGAGVADAAWLAQLTASAAITGPRTCVCRRERLLAELHAVAPRAGGAVRDLAPFVTRLRADQARGARLVFTNGCFDILHRGHVQFLSQARALGDLLVVAVNSDASVTRLKGLGRPVNHLEDRVAILSALSCVDHVVVRRGLAGAAARGAASGGLRQGRRLPRRPAARGGPGRTVGRAGAHPRLRAGPVHLGDHRADPVPPVAGRAMTTPARTWPSRSSAAPITSSTRMSVRNESVCAHRSPSRAG